MKAATAMVAVLVAGGVAAAQDIRVEGGGGTLAPGAEQTIAAAGPELQACYKDHGSRYVGGHVSLAVKVGTDGKKKNVWVDGGDLGSWAVEKCLLGVGKKLGFGAAKGGDVTVSVPLDFQATAEPAPMDPAQTKEAAAKLKALHRCGAARSTDVTIYVGPGGRILSLGFARPPSEKWADCAAAEAEKVVLADPRGQVVKGTVQP